MPEDANITDGRIADLALANMAKLIAAPNPFALAVGFHKPHLPWAVPKSYYDFQPAVETIPLASNRTAPVDMPAVAFWDCAKSELRGYSNVDIEPGTPLDPTLARQWRRGYYAAVRYTDAQIGRVLAGLKAGGVEDQTLVIFHADHGWQLGEHGEWCKQTTFELATRVPLMIKMPGARLLGRILTVLPALSWIYVGNHRHRVLPSPICA